MKTEYHKDTNATLVTCKAGKAFDACGLPAPHWYYSVVYKWSDCKQTYWVRAVLLAGTGTAVNQITRETRTATWEEVSHLLDYLKELEMHYKQVYGE